MRRREVLAGLGGTAVWPLMAHAQQPRQMRRIAILMGADDKDPEAQASVAAFREDLRKYGWTEGRNAQIDIRWAKADLEVMKRSAEELLTLQPEVILTSSTPAAGVMLQQTRTVPIVFVLVADPVGSKYVASLPKPGGNITGFTPIVGSLGGKWVELLKEIAPRIGKVSLMFNPATSSTFIEAFLGSFKSAAASLAVDTNVAPVANMQEVEALIAASEANGGVVVIPDAFTSAHRGEITSLAVRYRVPAISWSRSFAELGGLISYGPFLVDEYRRAASYADRILRGEKPGELPVQTPVKFELVVNLKTAKTFGLTLPDKLRALADDVID
jgi:putative tryptophan/tyrosine transport system substrate-binding protein